MCVARARGRHLPPVAVGRRRESVAGPLLRAGNQARGESGARERRSAGELAHENRGGAEEPAVKKRGGAEKRARAGKQGRQKPKWSKREKTTHTFQARQKPDGPKRKENTSGRSARTTQIVALTICVVLRSSRDGHRTGARAGPSPEPPLSLLLLLLLRLRLRRRRRRRRPDGRKGRGQLKAARLGARSSTRTPHTHTGQI